MKNGFIGYLKDKFDYLKDDKINVIIFMGCDRCMLLKKMLDSSNIKYNEIDCLIHHDLADFLEANYKISHYPIIIDFNNNACKVHVNFLDYNDIIANHQDVFCIYYSVIDLIDGIKNNHKSTVKRY